MFDKGIVRWFLEEKLEEYEIEIPKDIDFDDLVEAFYQYLWDDYYEWLKDNFRCFFSVDHDWDWIRDRIKRVKEKQNIRSDRKRTHKRRKR